MVWLVKCQTNHQHKITVGHQTKTDQNGLAVQNQVVQTYCQCIFHCILCRNKQMSMHAIVMTDQTGCWSDTWPTIMWRLFCALGSTELRFHSCSKGVYWWQPVYNGMHMHVCRDELKEALKNGNSEELKAILEKVKAERNHCEPVLNLQYRVSQCSWNRNQCLW